MKSKVSLLVTFALCTRGLGQIGTQIKHPGVEESHTQVFRILSNVHFIIGLV